jgi:HPt (histidine-containing phosphotransfer) domain-containing protein
LHCFKGLSATIGVQELSDLALNAEKLAKAGTAGTGGTGGTGGEALRAALGTFSGRLQSLLPLLEQVADRLVDASTEETPVPALETPADTDTQQSLETLLTALRASDMAALELHAHLRQRQRGALAQAMAPLDRAMADLEFEQAAVACEQLVRTFNAT